MLTFNFRQCLKNVYIKILSKCQENMFMHLWHGLLTVMQKVNMLSAIGHCRWKDWIANQSVNNQGLGWNLEFEFRIYTQDLLYDHSKSKEIFYQ